MAHENSLRSDIPPIGLGTFSLRGFGLCADTVKTALDLGYRHVDTAQRYQNERAVGDGITQASIPRTDIFIASKIWHDRLSYHDVKLAAHDSLDRLGVDKLDVLYIHWPINTYDPTTTLRAFTELYQEGYINNFGVSNFTPELLEEARSYLDIPIVANQIEMHPLLHQESIRSYCIEHDIAVVAYSPLAKGDVFTITELNEIADKHDVTEAQVSLAWLQEKNVTPIPKTSFIPHLRENWNSQQLTLEPNDIEKIDGIDREKRYVNIPGSPFPPKP